VSELAPAEEQPDDAFGETRREMTHVDPYMKKTQEKIYREVMLGGGPRNKNMDVFMEYDRQVCRFYAGQTI
jgi:hypothetical protein